MTPRCAALAPPTMLRHGTWRCGMKPPGARRGATAAGTFAARAYLSPRPQLRGRVQGLVMTEEQPPITVKGFPKPISGYKLVGTYDDLVKAGRVVLEERDGLRVLVDLTKQSKAEVIQILQTILDSRRS